MKKLVISATCALNLTLSPLVQAGVSTSGGGNTAENQMIENFAIKSVLTDGRFKGAIEILNDLESRSPYLARTLKSGLQMLTWYVVPRDLKSLPQYQTGLSFNTDQTAFQRHGEVFINASDLDSMIRKNTHSELVIHELLMSEVLKYEGKADDVAHSRVRKMTNAILHGVSGDALNVAIQSNGFTKSASDDVWNYTLVEAGPGVENPGGRSLILAKKGARFVIYTCSADALESIRESQIESNSKIPANFSKLANETVRGSGCQLTTPVMYTITRQMQKEGLQFLSASVEKTGSRACAVAAGSSIAAGITWGTLVATETRAMGVILGSILGVFVGTAGCGIAAIAGKSAQAAKNKKMNLALEINGQDGNSIVKSIKKIDETATELVTGLNQLASKGLITKTSVTAKKN